MREIKFRGKRKNNGEWVYGCYYQYSDGRVAILTHEDIGFQYWTGKQQVDPKTVGQYTGLKDKNDKEIYEGDIVKANMDFGPGGMAEQTTSIYWDENVGGWQFNYFDKATIEIIGNIHDNPELLEEHYDY